MRVQQPGIVGSSIGYRAPRLAYRIGQPPDDDFRFMTHVTLLAPSSAASMYARLTSAVAAAMGVQVLPGPVGA